MTRPLAAVGVLVVLVVAVPAQPPAAPQVTIMLPDDPVVREIAKSLAHVTQDEMKSWHKRLPQTAQEALEMAQDLLGATKQIDQAQAEMRDNKHAAARDAMLRGLALMFKHYHEDSPATGDAYGLLGVLHLKCGDVVAADEAFRKQRACTSRLFPPARFPDGHPFMAIRLLTFGTGQAELGRHAEAEAAYRDALKMYRRHGPANPDGSDFTTLLIQLGVCLFNRREMAESEQHMREAMKRCEDHCATPAGKAKFGHLLAKTKNNLGELLRARGETAEAERLLAEAAALNRGVNPTSHAINLRNQAIAAVDAGDLARAKPLADEAVRTTEAVYPAAQYPKGHPDLVTVLRGRAEVLAGSGDRAAADADLIRSLDMVRAIYPDDRCPDGHPELAETLYLLGMTALRSAAAADQRAAAGHLRDSLRITLAHTRAQSAYLSEAAVLRLTQVGTRALDGLLSVAGPSDPRDYWFVWESKAAAMRLLDARRRAAVGQTDPAVKRLIDDLAAARAAVEAHATGPADAVPSGAADELTRRKEDLEVRLAAAQGLPLPPRATAGPAALAAALPAGAVFLDFWAHVRIEQDPANAGNTGRRGAIEYAVFVVAAGREVVRVRLGPAAAIDTAIEEWVAAITLKDPDGLLERKRAERVAELVWHPLRSHLPQNLTAVYVCPDLAIGRLPFSALPDDTGAKVLLETAKVVEVPHGPGLHATLIRRPPAPAGPTRVLTVGDLDYGEPVKHFDPLKGAAAELKAIQETAARTGVSPPDSLTGGTVRPEDVRSKLAGVRVAHFATHAFADRLPVSPDAVARNPFLTCGLALSGANVNAGGLLLAESIAGLRLNDLDVAVLSACNTGLGLDWAGQGTFALRRAFHTSGCRAVVASLWSVGDLSSAALMARFYHHLWAEGCSPEDALWKAQRDLYADPAQIPVWADGTRGDGPRTVAVRPNPPAPPVIRDSLPRKWAGFQISLTAPPEGP